MTQPRYATLDAWRGLACLAVICFHSAAAYVVDADFLARLHADGGSVADWGCLVCWRLWIGVPLFFVISGYCIAAAAVNTVERGRSIRDFLIRRFRRIYPPLWIYLIASAVVLMLPVLTIPLEVMTPWIAAGPATERAAPTLTLPVASARTCVFST